MKQKILSIFDNSEDETVERVHVRFNPDTETLQKLKPEDLISFNSEAERQFVEFVCSLVSEFDKLTQRDVIQETSFELNISPVTAKRYLMKHTARRAQLQIVNSFVRCKCDLHRKYEVKILKKNPHKY